MCKGAGAAVWRKERSMSPQLEHKIEREFKKPKPHRYPKAAEKEIPGKFPPAAWELSCRCIYLFRV